MLMVWMLFLVLAGRCNSLQYSSLRSSTFYATTPLRIPAATRSFSPSTITMMPEGPEVKTIANALKLNVVGKSLTDITFNSGRYVNHGPPKNFEEFKASFPATVSEWCCKGKFQYFKLSVAHPEHRSCWITLGMSGRFIFAPPDATPHKHARATFHLVNEKTGSPADLVFVDTRNFGTIHFTLEEALLQAKLKTLGPSILESELTPEMFLEICNTKKNPTINICKFLMNQKKISGVGNYILSEALYKARINPYSAVGELTTTELFLLLEEIQSTASQSLAAQGHTREKGGSFRSVSGYKGTFELVCYGRKICPAGYPITRETNGPHKRSLWWVPELQQK